MLESPPTNPWQLLNLLGTGLVMHAADTSISYINPAALKMLRLTVDKALGKVVSDPHWRFIDVNGDPLPLADYPVNQIINTKMAIKDFVVGILDSSSDIPVWVRVAGAPELNELNEVTQVVVTFIEISPPKNGFSFEEIVNMANDVVVVTEADPIDPPGPKIVYVNQAFTNLTGYTSKEVIGKDPRFLQGDDVDKEELKKLKQSLIQGRDHRATVLNYSKTGRAYWLDMNIVPLRNWSGKVTHFAAIERDVSDIKRTEQTLRDHALHDPLTGLLNRRGLDIQSEVFNSRAENGPMPVCVIVLDIDHFKRINDTWGHEAGDEVLVATSDLMKKAMRGDDLVSRVGGEEFLIILPDTELTTAEKIADRLRVEVMNMEVKIKNGTVVKLTVSMGVSQMQEVDAAIKDTARRADAALYEAKMSGRNRVIKAT